ncbi:MAG: tRNA pseudouridine(38-40) synthase TruA [Coriobacteriia bacterium]|nr:tRNA pseudouridine(38-40) synthase TruA [Coriobacteriia bacterium]
MSVALRVAYDGASFAGFARQRGLETVQGRLEDALRTAMRRDVPTVGAGRTDAGVHALGQVVSFAAGAGEIDPPELLRSLNALAGPRIVVTDVRLTPPGFDARHWATSREYRYRLVPGSVPPLFLARFAWWVRALDVRAMREAAGPLVGEHDFTSFCRADGVEGRRVVRTLGALDVEPDSEMGEHCLVVRARARSFMRSMVRILVGTLVEVGTGRRAPEWAAEALAARDRAAAGPTAPPHGLTLWSVEYPEGVWL